MRGISWNLRVDSTILRGRFYDSVCGFYDSACGFYGWNLVESCGIRKIMAIQSNRFCNAESRTQKRRISHAKTQNLARKNAESTPIIHSKAFAKRRILSPSTNLKSTKRFYKSLRKFLFFFNKLLRFTILHFTKIIRKMERL